MDAVTLARSLAAGGRVNQLGAFGSATHLFRVHASGQPFMLRVYDTESYARREERSFSALDGTPGTPQILDRGDIEGLHWVRFADPGAWTMASLPENPSTARKAGEILRAVHTLATDNASNLHGGMTGDQVATDFQSTFQRLAKYRGRLNMPADVITAALNVPPPRSSVATLSHTNPRADHFFVNDQNEVTLLDWTWSTLTPPEWDYSLAYWSFASTISPHTPQHMAEGYGATLGDDDLRPWVVYHIGAFLVREAETSSGRLDHLSRYVDQLTAYSTV